MSDMLFVGCYNLENLFEPGNHPELKAAWDQERYDLKISHIAEVISSMHDGAGPDLLGVCEIESEDGLQNLIDELPSGSDYGWVHEHSDDVRQIDVGMIYRKSKLSYGDVEVFNIRKRYPTRDILDVHFDVDGTELHVIGNHWPSRSGGQYESEPYRILVAENCSWIVQQHYREDPDTNILVMGDFNDDPFNRSVQEYLLAIRNQRRVANRRGGERSRPYLYNLSWSLMGGLRPGTFYYGSNPAGWNMLDQMMVSKGLLTGKKDLRVKEESIEIFRPDRISERGKPKPFRKKRSGWVEGYSDHFPITARIEIV